MSATLDPELASEVQTVLADMCSSRDGVAALVVMLKTADASWLTGDGLATLLDGVRTRLDLACDGLQGAALQLGLEPPL